MVTLPTKQKFNEYVEMGLVQRRNHNVLPLSIYTYTILTNYERLWNSVTRSARGVVFDNKGRCVVRCLPKFFNEDEPHATCTIDHRIKPLFYDKLDGSLIQVVNDPEYGMVVTSKGSFHSKHADWARDYIADHYKLEQFTPGLTYVFELIHPSNRIVLDYGDTFKLVLLAVIDIDMGAERDIYDPEFADFEPAKIVADLDGYLNGELVEGVVAKVGTQRYKIKTGEYVRLHRIVTEFTLKRVWEALSNGESLEFQNMPEEFQGWLDTTIASLRHDYDTLHSLIMDEFLATQEMTPKEIGLADNLQYKGFIFSLRNGRDISQDIWKRVKPKEESTV